MQWIDELRMETPEQIEVNLELAGLGSRFIAQLADWLLKALVILFLSIITLLVSAFMETSAAKWFDKHPSNMVIALFIIVLYLLLLSYGLFFEAFWKGQTPGKWLVGIRVIRENGSPINFQAAAIRNLLAMADFLPAFFLFGAVVVMLTSRRQRLGDMAAGTIVLRERLGDLGKAPEKAIRDYASEKYAFTNIQLANLSTTDRIVLREFLRRCNDMDGRNGPRLAKRLARRYLVKTGYPLERKGFRTGAAARRFLASLLRDLQEFIRNK
jgi:uncharacterized RDD family membrane protein YckC